MSEDGFLSPDSTGYYTKDLVVTVFRLIPEYSGKKIAIKTFDSHVAVYIELVLTGRGVTIPTEESERSGHLGGAFRGTIGNSGLSGRKEQPRFLVLQIA